jgi:NAD(P)-dependent dehydrogenase (short-subunit alcohol dehydrogenase family)
MAQLFITGSADGLGHLAAKVLIDQGHRVVLHARTVERGTQAQERLPGAAGVLIADLSSIEETKALAVQANALGTFDAVIHNAGVYQIPKTSIGPEGLPVLFTVNSLAPYLLTCLMRKPERLIYLSSGMHLQGNPVLNLPPDSTSNRSREVTYADTKLHAVILAMAVARKWKDVYANAVNPGWVPTKMGGASAPDDLEKGYQTQAWLAVSDEPGARVSGHYFYHQRPVHYLPAAGEATIQEAFLSLCEQITGVRLGEEMPDTQ